MTDWISVADRVLAILTRVAKHRESFAAEAAKRGITVEQLTAAAITEAVREQAEQSTQPAP